MSGVLSSIKRTPYQSFAAILVLFFTLFLIGALITTVTFLYGLLGYVEGQPQVTAYFTTDTQESTILSVRDELEASPMVSAVEYVSKEEAYEIYKELNQDNEVLIEMTSPDILPASINVFATKPQYLAEIAQVLEERDDIDEIQFQAILVDRLLALTNAIRNAALVLGAFLGIMAVIVIIATTSFKISRRKQEIELMELLGASRFFIMKPFLAEGVLIGTLASVLSIFTLIGATLLANPHLTSYLQGITTITFSIDNQFSLVVWPFNVTFFFIVFLIIWIFGVTLGLVANLLAARRYLA